MDSSIYKLRISPRARSYHLEIDWEHGLVVVVPKRWSQYWVDHLLRTKEPWIKKQLKRLEKEKQQTPTLEIKKFSKQEILETFQREVEKQAQIMKLSFRSVSIRKQKTRWGSCSSRGNLSFNSLLINAPTEIRNYVIVHELSHLLVHNHSSRFWNLVEIYCPKFKEYRRWLRTNGRILTNGVNIAENQEI